MGKKGRGTWICFLRKKDVSLRLMRISIIGLNALTQGVKYGHQKEMQPRADVNSGETAGTINIKTIGEHI